MYKQDSLLDSVHKKDSLHRKAEKVESLQEVGGRVGKLPQSLRMSHDGREKCMDDGKKSVLWWSVGKGRERCKGSLESCCAISDM